MSSGVFKDYAGRGLDAALPAPGTLAIPAGTSAYYWATDTKKLYMLDATAAAWVVSNAGGGGGGSSAVGSHRYWRLASRQQYDYGNYSGYSGVQMRGAIGGPNLAVGGTAIGTPGPQAGTLASIFPGDGTTGLVQYNSWQQMWVGYDFGAPVSIKEIAIYPDYGAAARTPNQIAVQYSDDGIEWINVAEYNLTFTVNVQTIFPVPVNFPGAAGGGGGAGAPSVLLQAAYARSSTGGTIALGVAPTVGNIMILMHIGASNGPPIPAGWSALAYLTETQGFATGQKFWLASKFVLAGETGSVNYGGTDFGNLALFELDKANLVDVVGLGIPAGAPFPAMPVNPKWGAGLRFFVAEHDQSDDLTFAAVTGMTVLNVYGGSSNHRGSLAKLDPAFYGNIQLQSSSASLTYPCIVSFSFGKI